MKFRFIYIFILFYLIIGLIIPCVAGEYGASFLEIGVGAKALSMGGAFCSISDDGTAFYWNPAGLGVLEKRILSGMYGQQFGTIQNPFGQFHYVGFTQPLAGQALPLMTWSNIRP